jgi:hypothetical protein
VFVLAHTFETSLMFVGKAKNLPGRGAPLRFFGLTRKH